MPRTRQPYDLTRRLLYGSQKTELSRKTGIALRTISRRAKDPEKTTLQELAQIVRAKEMTAEEVMLILKDCT